MEKRYLKPPNLIPQNLKAKILCYRARYKDNPAIFASSYGDKYILHNYGYGGKGWVLAPGAAQYAVGVFLNDLKQKLGKGWQDQNIAIVGAGINGLMCAFELCKRGGKKVTVIADNFTDTASSNASGLIFVHRRYSPLFAKMALDSYRFYQSVANGAYEYLTGGVRRIPIYFDSLANSGLEFFVEQSLILPAKKVLVDFQNGITREMVVYDEEIFLETNKFLLKLKQFLAGQVAFEKRNITCLEEIAQKFIFNCSGLGARVLNQDLGVRPVKGHIITLKNHFASDLDYALHVKEDIFSKKSLKEALIKRILIITPKMAEDSAEVGYIGTTFIEDHNSSNIYEEEFEILQQNTQKFCGI